MKIKRFAFLAAAMAGAAVGLAAPASAELTDGAYEMRYVKNPSPTPDIIVVTSCGAGCKHFQMNGPYEPFEYHLEGNTWTAPSKNGLPNTIDNNTLAGSENTWEFQLVKVG
jgi:hypothetical protein